jgi:hypothetical protein
MISGAVSRLSDAKEKNGGGLQHQEMSEILQGLRDNGATTTRNALNHLLRRHVRPARERDDLFPPLSVIDMNVEQDSNVSSLHGVEGVEKFPVTTNNKKGGRPKGRTRLFAANETKRSEKCKVKIAKGYL